MDEETIAIAIEPLFPPLIFIVVLLFVLSCSLNTDKLFTLRSTSA